MAAWSGVLFALLFTAGLILVRQAPGPAEPDADYVAFYSSGWGGVLVVLGLYIQDCHAAPGGRDGAIAA